MDHFKVVRYILKVKLTGKDTMEYEQDTRLQIKGRGAHAPHRRQPLQAGLLSIDCGALVHASGHCCAALLQW